MDARKSPPAAAFAKALRSMETGGLSYGDVLAELKDLLAADTSPTELRDILLGRDLIEPLSVQARVEMLGILNGAMLRERRRAAAQAEAAKNSPEETSASQGGPAPPAEPTAEIPDSFGLARVEALEEDLASALTALESERRATREAAKAAAAKAADSLTSLDAAQSRADQAMTDAERARMEVQSLRAALSERDADLVQLRQSMSQRDADLVQLRQSIGQRDADLVQLRQSMSQRDADLVQLRQSIGQRDADLVQLRQSIGQLEAKLASSSRDQTELSAALDARNAGARKLESDMAAAQARESALMAELSQARAALESQESRVQGNAKSLKDKLSSTEAALATLQREHSIQVTALGALTKKRAQLEADLHAARALADSLSIELKSSREEVRLLFGAKPEPQATPGPQVLQGPQVVPFPATPPASHPAPTRVMAAPMVVEPKLAQRKPLPPAAVAPARSAAKRYLAAAAAAIAGLVLLVLWRLNRPVSIPEGAQTPAAQVETPSPGTTIRDCPACPAMTVLPAGRFKQGSPSGDGGAPSFEKPQHWVAVGKSVAMSTTPVTVEEFDRFIAATGRDMQGCDIYEGNWIHRPEKSWKDPGFVQTGTHPVTCVSSNDAAAYAAWLSTETGHKYRLPSASEWEYAARAGGDAIRPWGDRATEACRYANVADRTAASRYPGWTIFACDDAYLNTSPVGTFEANAFGLQDMLGNVFQWTEDCWNADYKGAPVDGSARSDGDCTQRELRGGSWFTSPDYVRANYRNRFAADYRTSSAGIRLVREVGS